MKKNGTDKKAEKIQEKKETPVIEKPKKESPKKDQFGFMGGSKSSEAVKLLASGKSTAKEVRRQFNTLSFTKLLAALEAYGFSLKENGDGKCSVTGKLKA